MKARVKATGEIWTFSQIDEITFKSAINEHLYCAEELEFIEASIFSPDYWEKLKHQYAGMAMQGFISNSVFFKEVDHVTNGKPENLIAAFAINISTVLVEKLKNE